MAFGFLTIFSGSFTGGIWLLLIAWFLQSGAQSYLQQHEITSALSGVRLYQIMNTQFVAVSPSMNIKEVLEAYFNIHRKSELPVVEIEADDTGNNYYYLLGSITAKDAMSVSEKRRGESMKVEEIMIEKKNLVIMSPDKTADIALNTIMEENKSRIYVCENPSIGRSSSSKRTEKMQEQMIMTYSTIKSDRLVGVVSKTDILNVAKERMEYTESMKKNKNI
jgi:CBS domain-containing protein